MNLLAATLIAATGWAAGAAEAPSTATAEQHFFDWTSLQFAKEVLAERRVALASTMGEKGSIFLAPSRDGFSGGETFRQLDDFLYFTSNVSS